MIQKERIQFLIEISLLLKASDKSIRRYTIFPFFFNSATRILNHQWKWFICAIPLEFLIRARRIISHSCMSCTILLRKWNHFLAIFRRLPKHAAREETISRQKLFYILVLSFDSSMLFMRMPGNDDDNYRHFSHSFGSEWILKWLAKEAFVADHIIECTFYVICGFFEQGKNWTDFTEIKEQKNTKPRFFYSDWMRRLLVVCLTNIMQMM